MEHFKYMPEMGRPVEAPETTRESEPSARSTISSNIPKPELSPMDKQTAAKLVRRLLAGYPNLNAHDPEGYVAVMVHTMAQYPQWAGERAILRVDEENKRFPPTDKELKSWLEDAVRPYKFAAEWEARSALQIAERGPETPALPKYSGVQGDGGPGTIYSDYEKAFEKFGRPIGVFETEKDLPKRG